MTSIEFDVARAGTTSQNELILYRLDQVEGSIKEIKQFFKEGLDRIEGKIEHKLDQFTKFQADTFARCQVSDRRTTNMESDFGESKTDIKELSRRIEDVNQKAAWANWKFAGVTGGLGLILITIQVLYYLGVFAA